MSIKSEEGTYKYIKATVQIDGIALNYQIPESPVAGSDFIDDDTARTWRDYEIRDTAARWLGVTEGADEIEVVFNVIE